MIKIQGKDYSNYLASREISLPRTYVGEIKRTQVGVVDTFPISYITVGFTLRFEGARAIIEEIEQLLLSANVVEVIMEYAGVNIKGKFSLTGNQSQELRDKGERNKSLEVTIVSDGTNITKPNGTGFIVKRGSTTLTSSAAFGKIYKVANASALNGATLPMQGSSYQVLVLGDTNLTAV